MTKLRGYECFYSHIGGNRMLPDDFNKNTNDACWAGIRGVKKGTVLHIVNFAYFDEKYINKLVYLLNRITPTVIKDGEILFTLPYDKYTKNLYLLDILRLLWYKVVGFRNKNFLMGISNELKLKCKFRDPLKILTFWINESINKDKKLYGDHSSIYNKYPNANSITKVRSLKELNMWGGNQAMMYFAIGEETD
jgi:hypothetical protein